MIPTSIVVGHVHEGMDVLVAYDVSRADCHGVPKRRLFIGLPTEENEDQAERMRI